MKKPRDERVAMNVRKSLERWSKKKTSIVLKFFVMFHMTGEERWLDKAAQYLGYDKINAWIKGIAGRSGLEELRAKWTGGVVKKSKSKGEVEVLVWSGEDG